MRLQFRPDARWSVGNTLSFGMLRQGGYPYASVATGRIAYNDPSGYRRTTLSDGLTVRCAADGWEIASITSYQYSDDRMTLDQDFLPDSYFTLTQAKRDHGFTEDIVIRSRDSSRYSWLAGAFGFYRHRTMQAPVLFKEDGLEPAHCRQGRAVHRPAASLRLRPDGARHRLPQPRMGCGALPRIAAPAGAVRPHGRRAPRLRAHTFALPQLDRHRLRLRRRAHHPLHRTGHAAPLVCATASQSDGALPHRRPQLALRLGRQRLQGGRIQHPDVLRRVTKQRHGAHGRLLGPSLRRRPRGGLRTRKELEFRSRQPLHARRRPPFAARRRFSTSSAAISSSPSSPKDRPPDA